MMKADLEAMSNQMHSGCKYMVAQPFWKPVQHYLAKHMPYPKPVTSICMRTHERDSCMSHWGTDTGCLQDSTSKLLVTNVHRQKWYLHTMEQRTAVKTKVQPRASTQTNSRIILRRESKSEKKVYTAIPFTKDIRSMQN